MKLHDKELASTFPSIYRMVPRASRGKKIVKEDASMVPRLLWTTIGDNLPAMIGDDKRRWYAKRTPIQAIMGIDASRGKRKRPNRFFSVPFYEWDDGRASGNTIEKAIIRSSLEEVKVIDEYLDMHLVLPSKTFRSPFFTRERFINDSLLKNKMGIDFDESLGAMIRATGSTSNIRWDDSHDKVLLDPVDIVLKEKVKGERPFLESLFHVFATNTGLLGSELKEKLIDLAFKEDEGDHDDLVDVLVDEIAHSENQNTETLKKFLDERNEKYFGNKHLVFITGDYFDAILRKYTSMETIPRNFGNKVRADFEFLEKHPKEAVRRALLINMDFYTGSLNEKFDGNINALCHAIKALTLSKDGEVSGKASLWLSKVKNECGIK